MADDCFLRAAFEEAVKNQAGRTLPLDHPGHPWHLLYSRVTDTDGGLAMIAEMDLLRTTIDRLESELAQEREKNAGVPVHVRPSLLPVR